MLNALAGLQECEETLKGCKVKESAVVGADTTWFCSEACQKIFQSLDRVAATLKPVGNMRFGTLEQCGQGRGAYCKGLPNAECTSVSPKHMFKEIQYQLQPKTVNADACISLRCCVHPSTACSAFFMASAPLRRTDRISASALASLASTSGAYRLQSSTGCSLAYTAWSVWCDSVTLVHSKPPQAGVNSLCCQGCFVYIQHRHAAWTAYHACPECSVIAW